MSSHEEIKIKRGELKVAKVTLAATAVLALVNIGIAIFFHLQEMDIEQKRLKIAEEEDSSKIARLDYDVSFRCISSESDYLVEVIRIINNGNASAEHVRFTLKDIGLEILGAVSLPPNEKIAVRPFTNTLPMLVDVPEIGRLDSGQSYAFEIRLAQYGQIDTKAMWQLFDHQRKSIELITATRRSSNASDSSLREIIGIPNLKTDKYTAQDELETVAKRNGITVDNLLLNNPILKEKGPAVGQILIIQPATCGTPENAGVAQVSRLGTHAVRQGETLACIARAYRIAPEAIASANGLEVPYLLQAGQVIEIPNVPWDDMPAGPICAVQFALPTPLPRPVCRTFYTVRWGDSLPMIAQRYSISVWQIFAANHLWNPNVIYAGQTLCIP